MLGAVPTWMVGLFKESFACLFLSVTDRIISSSGPSNRLPGARQEKSKNHNLNRLSRSDDRLQHKNVGRKKNWTQFFLPDWPGNKNSEAGFFSARAKNDPANKMSGSLFNFISFSPEIERQRFEGFSSSLYVMHARVATTLDWRGFLFSMIAILSIIL